MAERLRCDRSNKRVRIPSITLACTGKRLGDMESVPVETHIREAINAHWTNLVKSPVSETGVILGSTPRWAAGLIP